MKKPIDGRTVKGERLRKQAREAILMAYIDLIRGGIAAPTARETAEKAEMSLRAIFNYFPDLRALRLAAFNRIQDQSNKFFVDKNPDQGSAAQRLERFLDIHTQRLEFVTPFHRTAAMVESIDPDVARAMRRARAQAARELEDAFGSTLKSFSPSNKRDLIVKLHTFCSWPCWELLRSHYHLPARRARSLLTEVALTTLAAAERTQRGSVA